MSASTNLFRSSVFRLGMVYVALFGASVLLLLGFIYWSTAGYMLRQADATIEAEITGLAEGYRSMGLLGLTRTIRERLSRTPAGPSVYLLVDTAYSPIIGNLDRWPDVGPDEQGWLNFRLGTQSVPENGTAHRGRARSFSLQGGYHLLVGRAGPLRAEISGGVVQYVETLGKRANIRSQLWVVGHQKFQVERRATLQCRQILVEHLGQQLVPR